MRLIDSTTLRLETLLEEGSVVASSNRNHLFTKVWIGLLMPRDGSTTMYIYREVMVIHYAKAKAKIHTVRSLQHFSF